MIFYHHALSIIDIILVFPFKSKVVTRCTIKMFDLPMEKCIPS